MVDDHWSVWLMFFVFAFHVIVSFLCLRYTRLGVRWRSLLSCPYSSCERTYFAHGEDIFLL